VDRVQDLGVYLRGWSVLVLVSLYQHCGRARIRHSPDPAQVPTVVTYCAFDNARTIMVSMCLLAH
jgi:hypothetical protein